jgi:hypothetical protein
MKTDDPEVERLKAQLRDAHETIGKLREEIAKPHRERAQAVLSYYRTSLQEELNPQFCTTTWTIRLTPRLVHVSITELARANLGEEAERYVQQRLARELAESLVKDWHEQQLFGKAKWITGSASISTAP